MTVRAERTNDTWRLTTPAYPAQVTPIENFVAALLGAEKQAVINSSEVTGKLKDFGLDPPLANLSIGSGSNRFHLHIGSRPPLSEQVYAQIAGSGEVLVLDAAFLKAAPASIDDWRSPMLVTLGGRTYDRLQIGSGQRLLEFERNPTNNIWRISKPTPARANNELVRQLIQFLTTAQVKNFVTDSPAADLERYGLQKPELELYFALDTNRITGFEFGSSPTNDPSVVYVRRLSTTNIVTVPRQIFEALSLPAKKFHDPRLITIEPSELTQIQVNGTNGFTLARMTNGQWQITAPTPMVADTELVKAFLTNIVLMELVDSAKDVPTDADLKQFGLTAPRYSLALFGGATNGLLMKVDFGAHKTDDTVYARRSDETPVYVTPLEELILPREGWRLRDRRVFDFQPTDVVSITFLLNDERMPLPRKGNAWSEDQIKNAEIEEAIFRLGRLHAYKWSSKGADRLATLGITNSSVEIEFGINRGSGVVPIKLHFGRKTVRDNVYAATILPGDTEPTAFEFPAKLFEQVAQAFGLRAQ
jgi:hypothetical protein